MFTKKFQDIVIIFHDFPGLENGLTKFHDFPGRVVTLSICSSSAVEHGNNNHQRHQTCDVYGEAKTVIITAGAISKLNREKCYHRFYQLKINIETLLSLSTGNSISTSYQWKDFTPLHDKIVSFINRMSTVLTGNRHRQSHLNLIQPASELNALGHIVTPLLSVEGCYLRLFPAEYHSLMTTLQFVLARPGPLLNPGTYKPSACFAVVFRDTTASTTLGGSRVQEGTRLAMDKPARH